MADESAYWPKIRTVKRTLTIQVSDAPFVGGLRPYKIEVVEYKDKGKIVLYARAANGGLPRSVACRLYGGYKQYPEAPLWVLELLSEAGWSLNKIWGSA